MRTTIEATSDVAVAEQFLAAVVSRDHGALRALLADDVWLRGMVVREVIERHDADGALEVFQGWFGGAIDVEVVDVSAEPVATRVRVAYRLRLRPDWAPDVWHLIEQTGYLRVHDSTIRRIDLVCTGFAPEVDHDHAIAVTSASTPG